MKKLIKKILKSIGFITIKEAHYLIKKFENQIDKPLFPRGHYYCPYPSKDSLNSSIISENQLLGINLNFENQILLLEKLRKFYLEIEWTSEKKKHLNYYYDNQYFSYSDSIFLHCICRYFKPQQIIEVGSGFSSAAMLDINSNYFNDKIKLKFIEPYPEERLYHLIEDRTNVIIDFVQNISLNTFKDLNRNDILFIDTSHVAKYQSDVNHIIFNILPQLKSGVIIHIHDIFYPFEYPIEWLKQGRAWNEAYLLRAFLQYNQDFEILLFPSYLENKIPDWLQENMPLCMERHEYIDLGSGPVLMDTTGQSIYLRKK